MPLVSVIIPTFNRPELLQLTLKAVAAQSFTDYEVIVVDDGTPGHANEEVCNAFNAVNYHKIDNSGGPSKPRNVGMDLAKGEFLAFCDDDDIWLPNKLKKQLTALQENPDFGLAHCPCDLINSNGELLGETIGKPGSPDVKHGDVKMRMMGNWTLMTPTVLMRKNLAEKVGYFNTTMPQAGEDAEYWTRCSFYTKFYYQDTSLVQYRKHNSNSKILKAKYVELPWHLKKALITLKDENLIEKFEYKILRNQLVRKQIRELPHNYSGSLGYLFKLNGLWFLNFGNLKLLMRIMMRQLFNTGKLL